MAPCLGGASRSRRTADRRSAARYPVTALTGRLVPDGELSEIPFSRTLPCAGNRDASQLTGRHRGEMRDWGACWMCAPRMRRDDSMPLTLSRSRDVESRRVATTELQESVVENLSRTRTNVDELIPGHVRKAGSTRPHIDIDVVEEWGMQSFPASDPPMNW